MEQYFSPPKQRLIYLLRIPYDTHKGCIKVGETTFESDRNDFSPNSRILNKAADKRIAQYTRTAGIPVQLLHTEMAVYEKDGKVEGFKDEDVHRLLLRSGIEKKVFDIVGRADEWFVIDLETAKRAIAAIKEGRESLHPSEISEGKTPIELRPSQEDAVAKTLKQFKHTNKMLWNAKMRFGKTIAALELVKRHGGFRRVLILTHRPVVNDSWFEDYGKVFYDRTDVLYGSKTNGESYASLEQKARQEKCSYIYFVSMQDLRGSELVGGNFDKNDEVFSTQWDLLIIDESHEGTQTSLGENVTKELVKKDTKILNLSGTPYNHISEFKEEEIYTWDYIMEQRAKQWWYDNHPLDPNPYAEMPKLNIYTYDLGRLMHDFADEDIAFNFREFFRTNSDGDFIHKKDVRAFLDLISRKDEDSAFPFANEHYRSIFRHTLWMVPGVKAAKALSAMLGKHPIFSGFEIVNVAGDGDEDEESGEALSRVNNAIGENPDETYTITLSCGRLTTGVSVKAWTGVLMLSGTYNTSASAYMQTIFRVQTPATINGRVKEDCYVFDFAPDRTLKVFANVANVSPKAGEQNSTDRQRLGEFLNFCPIISIEGSTVQRFDVDGMLQHIKRAYVERVVRSGFEDDALYNAEQLYTLDTEAIDKLNWIGKAIGKTQAQKKTGEVDINHQGFTNEEYEQLQTAIKKPKKERTPEDNAIIEERNKRMEMRKNAISILRSISIRMPLLIYGADIKDEDEDKKLTIDNFTQLVDDQSWDEFMPMCSFEETGVDGRTYKYKRPLTKDEFNDFKRYYDPDIFSAAGKRIRQVVRAADNLTIEERIERISSLFAMFRNPDKETVLTPWRVINMHMSDTLGGYCFYNEDFTAPIIEPRFVERGNVTANVFTPGSHLLEINSKTGLYPLYLAYNVYRALLRNQTNSPETIEEHQAIWDQAVAESIFVICKTPMAKSITRRTLLGFRKGKTNMWAPDDLINKIKNQPELFIKKVHDLIGKNMRINAIVGNPPYQEVVAQKETSNGQKRSSNIFHHFQILSEKLGRYTSLIYPGARWIHRSGKGLEQFGLSQINDPHLKLLKYFPDSADVFCDVGIADGISIVLKDSKKESKGFTYIYSLNGNDITIQAPNPGKELFPLNPFSNQIVSQLDKLIEKYGCMHESVLSQKLFSIESDFVERNPTLVREYNEGEPFDKNHEIKLFTNDKAGKSGRARWYVADRSVITTGIEYLNRWKVIVSSANAGGQKRSNQIAVIDNYSAFGRSRVALKTFSTQREAENFLKYATSEIIRFAFLLTDESLTSLAKKVPDILDYSDDNGIIDFEKDVNAQLYGLLEISPTDQLFIKKTLAEKDK